MAVWSAPSKTRLCIRKTGKTHWMRVDLVILELGSAQSLGSLIEDLRTIKAGHISFGLPHLVIKSFKQNSRWHEWKWFQYRQRVRIQALRMMDGFACLSFGKVEERCGVGTSFKELGKARISNGAKGRSKSSKQQATSHKVWTPLLGTPFSCCPAPVPPLEQVRLESGAGCRPSSLPSRTLY